MKNDWIMDVLADLRTFSEANGLTALAEQLEDSMLVARNELASQSEGAGVEQSIEAGQARTGTGVTGTGF